ncbi:hypothetical protein F3Y22_tig00110065pilonHSYRG00122 [Hibiscus syriacus]|uniref:Uncharacterized protein n=1 Tax=Hibiscus syriacus TaxID=106335 RepID=A0A6A3BMD2_HIBSY|nr:hypothetical protein F3Y22_tig00110065pilonHSYRG00122 [Hibiscus syriacus]
MHPEGTPRIDESYAPKDRMPTEEQKEIREIREQMTKMMDRISVLDKEKETPTQKERELNEPNSTMSDTQGTSDLNQFEKLQTIIIRIHKSSGDTEEMMTTVKASRDEKKSCNLKSSKFSLLPTSKTQVQSKTKGGSHVDAIPISYKELYEKLFEAREVAPYYIKPFQPPYPNWYDINVHCEYHAGAQGHTIENCLAFKRRVQSLLDHGTLQFMVNDRPSLVTKGPARLIPKVFKGLCQGMWKSNKSTKIGYDPRNATEIKLKQSKEEVQKPLKKAKKGKNKVIPLIPIPIPYSDLLPFLFESGLVTLIPPRAYYWRPDWQEAQIIAPYRAKPLLLPYPSWYNEKVFCDYHAGARGHSIENCDFLRISKAVGNIKSLVNTTPIIAARCIQNQNKTVITKESCSEYKPNFHSKKKMIESVQEEGEICASESLSKEVDTKNDQEMRGKWDKNSGPIAHPTL